MRTGMRLDFCYLEIRKVTQIFPENVDNDMGECAQSKTWLEHQKRHCFPVIFYHP